MDQILSLSKQSGNKIITSILMLSSENSSYRTSKPVLIHKQERILNVEIPKNCETMWANDIDPYSGFIFATNIG